MADSVIAIHGFGPIGLFAVNAAKAMGAKFVIAIDWDNQMRMDLAKKLGADLVLARMMTLLNQFYSHTTVKV